MEERGTMGDFYLRVEAVNLANTVYDTYDISTIRGGSFMLLEAIEVLENTRKCAVSNQLEPISKGASTGLYRLISVTDNGKAKEVKEEVLKCLHDIAHDSTFVVDYCQFSDKDDFQTNLKRLMCQNRWSQFQQQTLMLPAQVANTVTQCAQDGLRPGIHSDPQGKKISTFTLLRQEKGRELRNTIYNKLVTELPPDLSFTNDLETLSFNLDKGTLNGKIAFIYLDGNKFGQIRDRYCTSPDLMKEFDKVVQKDLRSTALRKILEEAQVNQDFKTNDGEIRMETLLWGGDEIEWVVPAWIARKVLEIFYGEHKTFTGQDSKGNSFAVPLTHSCGLVFCHHNAPILQIRRLAHDLADKVKERITENLKTKNPDDPLSALQKHEQGDWIQYLVLESFDMLESNLDLFARHYYLNVARNFTDCLESLRE